MSGTPKGGLSSSLFRLICRTTPRRGATQLSRLLHFVSGARPCSGVWRLRGELPHSAWKAFRPSNWRADNRPFGISDRPSFHNERDRMADDLIGLLGTTDYLEPSRTGRLGVDHRTARNVAGPPYVKQTRKLGAGSGLRRTVVKAAEPPLFSW